MTKTISGSFCFAILLGAVLPGLSLAQDARTWHTRYKPAVEAAEAQKKNLLIVFTGSDWIDICKTFETDILQQQSFLEPISEKYVLLKLDYPKDNRLEEDKAKEYQLLKDAYRVTGFPTVMATDSRGFPFGMNGYQPISAEEYAKVMLALTKAREIRDEAREKAKSLKGLEQAKVLVDAVPDLPGTLAARYYRDVMQKVVELDPKNKTGKAESYRRQLADVAYSRQMQLLATDVQYAKMIELTDRYIKDQKLEGDMLQKALFNKLGIQQKQKNVAGSIQTLLEVVEVDPESHYGKTAQKMLDQMRAQKLQEDLGE